LRACFEARSAPQSDRIDRFAGMRAVVCDLLFKLDIILDKNFRFSRNIGNLIFVDPAP
jgi:hypothetical protein